MKGCRKGPKQLTSDIQAEEVAEVSRLLQALIRRLVDHPDQVTVFVISDARQATFQVGLSQSDVGKVIGRGGRVAIALRIILACIAKKLKLDFRLDIVSHEETLIDADQHIRGDA
jgi:predicted RNA-binding protein YlqC (UPF0109 family)